MAAAGRLQGAPAMDGGTRIVIVDPGLLAKTACLHSSLLDKGL